MQQCGSNVYGTEKCNIDTTFCSEHDPWYIFICVFCVCVVAASIMLPQNGSHGMVPQGRLDSPSSYYSYSPHTQDPGQPTMVPMHPGLPNGQPPALSPAGNPHKRLKRPAMSSISSADDDVESVGEEGENLSGYYTKSAGLAQHQWQSEHVDHGK